MRIKWGLRIFAFSLAIAQVWAGYHTLGPDGVSYLDLSDGIVDTQLERLINAYWGPLYPALIGFVRAFLPKRIGMELVAAQIANLIVFCLLWFNFESLLRKTENVSIGDKTLLATFLLWSTWALVSIGQVGNDLFLLAISLAATSQGLCFIKQPNSKSFLCLCLLLSLGYLTKAIFLVPGLLVLLITGYAITKKHISVRVCVAGFLLYLSLSGTWIALLSYSKGRFTAGDVGSLSYAWYVNNAREYIHWRGEEAVHPSIQIFSAPPTYYFGDVFTATFPLWFDPSYWNEGLKPKLNLSKWARLAARESHSLFTGFISLTGFNLFFLCLIVAFSHGTQRQDIWKLMVFALPLCSGPFLLALLHVEWRLIAPFVVPLCIVLYLLSPRVTGRVAMAAALLIGLSFVPQTASRASQAPLVNPIIAEAEASRQFKINQSRIAVIGYPFDHYWARVAGVQIVAHVDADPAMLCQINAETRERLFQSLREKGCVSLVWRVVLPACALGYQTFGDLVFVSLEKQDISLE